MIRIGKLLSGPRGYQGRIARECGLSRAMISLLKSGRRALRLDMAQDLARATGTEVVLREGEIRFERRVASKTKSKPSK